MECLRAVDCGLWIKAFLENLGARQAATATETPRWKVPSKALSLLSLSLYYKAVRVSPEHSGGVTELSGNWATLRHATSPEVVNHHRWNANGFALGPPRVPIKQQTRKRGAYVLVHQTYATARAGRS